MRHYVKIGVREEGPLMGEMTDAHASNIEDGMDIRSIMPGTALRLRRDFLRIG